MAGFRSCKTGTSAIPGGRPTDIGRLCRGTKKIPSLKRDWGFSLFDA